MKNRFKLLRLATLLVMASTLYQSSKVRAQGTAFTYQGQLQNGGALPSGTFNLTFALFTNNAGGTAVAGPVTNNGVGVSNGLFTVIIDFGAGPWTGVSNWLEIGVETNGAGSFTTLAPRQELTPSPYAIFANTASNLSGTLPTTQLNGTITDVQLLHDAVNVNPGPGLSGGGRVLLGNTIVLTNTGVLSVIGNSDITASTLNGAVTLGDTGTNTDTPDTLVKRDAGGNFSTATISLDGNLNLPATTATAGIIYSGGVTMIQAFGSQNFFAGPAAGNLTMSGINSTANGYHALFFNTSGSDETAIGTAALLLNTNGSDNTAIGTFALFNNTSGSSNTASGSQAMFANTTGSNNTANGAYSLYNNTSGVNNTASGADALFSNTTGFDNSANGESALFSNTNGTDNTASGYRALYLNTSGTDNTADGRAALFNNVTGSHNTAVGVQALNANTNGGDNTALGYAALFNNASGTGNTAIGDVALFNLTSGDQNTAVGVFSLGKLTAGNHNAALGYDAGVNVTNGTNNIEIGTGGAAADNQMIRIGNGQTNTFIAGISGVTISPAGAAVFVNSDGELGTVNSSRRYKENIQDMGDQSDVLLSLRPVAFRYKHELDPLGTPQFGLIAEEVEKVAPELVLRDDQGKIYSVRYEQINAMLLNEFLKQHRTVEDQRAEIRQLKEEHPTVEEQNTKLEELGQKLDAQNNENLNLKQRLEALEKIVLGQKSN